MKPKLVLTFFICLCLAAIFPSTALAGKDYKAERFDVLMDVQPDGSLLVTETVVFHFQGGPFTYVFREIERRNLDDLQILEVLLNGGTLPEGAEAGQAEIAGSDPVRVTWRFAPISDSTHEFILRYRVEGAIQTGVEGDLLRWIAIPADHDYRITTASTTLTYPAGVHLSEEPTLNRTFETRRLNTGYRLSVGQMEINENLILTARFPAGSLVSTPPDWQVRQEAADSNARRVLPLGLGTAVLTSLGGLAAVIAALRSFRRQGYVPMDPMRKITSLPGEVPPAMAARLAGTGTPFLGTLFDLTRRGVLQFEEGPKQWGSRTFEVLLQSAAGQFEPHGHVFVEELFKKKNRVPLSNIASLASTSRFTEALDSELTAAGWRDSDRVSQRTTFLWISALALVGGIVLAGAGLVLVNLPQVPLAWIVSIGAILIGAGVSLGAVGLFGLLAAGLTSVLSDEGERQADSWKRFNQYLHNITRDREPVTSPDLFERFLPYAAGLGMATEWAKFFQKQANIPIPEWFLSLQSGMDDGSFVAILAVISAADSSASAASGSDGGGASGGGSSGAG